LGGTWRLAGCRDSWSKYGLGWQVPRWRTSTTRSVELALAEAEQLAGARLIDPAPRDADRTVLPLMTNGGSLVGLDFDATVSYPAYDWMGVAKAALESTSRYVARGGVSSARITHEEPACLAPLCVDQRRRGSVTMRIGFCDALPAPG